MHDESRNEISVGVLEALHEVTRGDHSDVMRHRRVERRSDTTRGHVLFGGWRAENGGKQANCVRSHEKGEEKSTVKPGIDSSGNLRVNDGPFRLRSASAVPSSA